MGRPPADHVPPFTRAQTKQRYRYIYTRAVRYVDEFKLENPEAKNLSFDPLVLRHVVQGALDDIWRYKVFHLRKRGLRSNCVKRAAYYTKWIVKLRPFFIARPTNAADFLADWRDDDRALFVNEAFALQFSVATICSQANRQVNLDLSEAFIKDFLYYLHFRHIHEDALLTIYQMLYSRAKGAGYISI